MTRTATGMRSSPAIPRRSTRRRCATQRLRIVRAAGLQIAQEQEQRLRFLIRHETVNRDLYRHGDRHQRPRTSGRWKSMGAIQDSHQRASRPPRTRRSCSIAALPAAGDREGSRRREAVYVPGTTRAWPAASRARPPWTASGRPRGWEIYWMEVERETPPRCAVGVAGGRPRSPARSGICRRRR